MDVNCTLTGIQPPGSNSSFFFLEHKPRNGLHKNNVKQQMWQLSVLAPRATVQDLLFFLN